MGIRQLFITKTWWGKFIGAFFGFLIAGPLGALLGLLVGNFFDRGLAEHFSKPFWFYYAEKDAQVRQRFFESTFLLFGYLAKTEGRVSEHAILAAKQTMQRMQLKSQEKQQAQDFFTMGKQKNFDLKHTLQQLSDAISQKPTLIRLFVETQYQFVRQTGLTEKKILVINTLLTTFRLAPLYEQQHVRDDFNWSNYSHYQHRQSSSQQSYQSPSSNQPLILSYQILGLTPAATQSEVKRAYRRLISANHPDRLIAKKASEQDIKKANEKTQQIRHAYEHICEVKNW